MRKTLFLTLLLLAPLLVMAQDDSPSSPAAENATCWPMLESFFTAASEVCLGQADDHFCNGGINPQTEPTISETPLFPGELIPVNEVDYIHTDAFAPDGRAGGLAWMRVSGTQMRGILIGDVGIRDVTPVEAGFPKWTAMIVETGDTLSDCAAIPRSAFMVQSNVPFEVIASTRVVINGASLDLRGTIIIHTLGNNTIFSAIEGEARIIANGGTQPLVAGQSVQITHEPDDFSRAVSQPGPAVPYDYSLLENIPVALLDRGTVLPQPGFVSTEGQVNMRAAPDINGSLLYQIPAGRTMAVLGSDPTGEWFHVRLTTGESGWMFANLLRRNHGVISTTYSATPQPVQRFGDLGTKATVISGADATLREAPDALFAAIGAVPNGTEVQLIARSPYSPWVKIDNNGQVGWLALSVLDTKSIIESLPVDFDVPPPPTPPPPTRVPGSWGGAFPDPSCYPDC